MVCRKSLILKVYFSSFFSPGFAPYFRMSECALEEGFYYLKTAIVLSNLDAYFNVTGCSIAAI